MKAVQWYSAVYSPLWLILPPSSPRLKACKVSPLHCASLERLSNPETSSGHFSYKLKKIYLTISKHCRKNNNILYIFAKWEVFMNKKCQKGNNDNTAKLPLAAFLAYFSIKTPGSLKKLPGVFYFTSFKLKSLYSKI